MTLETEIYQILKNHKLGLKKREELIVDLLDFINKREEQLPLHVVMPSIGRTYSIIQNGKRIFGTVESHQGNTGKFWVRWNDGEMTLENKIDNCR